MRDLAAAQALFGTALANPAPGKDAVELFSGDADCVRGRLAVYRGHVIANAGKALAAAYPVVRQLVGDEFFDGLARAYAGAYPAASGDLNEYGERFASFLDAFAHVRDLPYLPDVARLERLVHRAHYAADHAAPDPARLACVAENDYARLVLELHPAAALFASAYPVGRIWQVHQPEHSGEIAVDLDSGAQSVLVHRPRFRAAVTLLGGGEAAFLTATAQGTPLGSALDRALAADARFDLAGSLQRWLGDNVLVDWKIAGQPV